MEFTTEISSYNTNFNLNEISDYNQFLRGNTSFNINKDLPSFEETLQTVTNKAPLKDKNDPTGLGNFMGEVTGAFGNSLNALNQAKLNAEHLQEDLAMGGSTSIHDAMIAAEKASLSMQMAIQVRNRIISAYTDITQMAI